MNDKEFIRGEVPMTKSEVRAITLSKLDIKKGMEILDIGAGTGSITVEAAMAGGILTAVERNPEGVELIKANKDKFQLDNIEIIKGLAPEALPEDKKFDRIFIGGSGGNLDSIFNYINKSLKPGGILVSNTITIENCSEILRQMEQRDFKNIEVVSVNISRSRKIKDIHMMIAENPITIISGERGEINV